MSKSLRPYLEFATDTIVEAGKITLGYFSRELKSSFKGDGSPVTEADQKTEQFIRRQIEAKYPTHDIVGEEFEAKKVKQRGYRWFIDPIDGTRYFIRGVPLYSVVIGLEIEGVVEVGLLYFPALGELLTAATGLGCWWNGKPARVSPVKRLEEGIVAYSDIAYFYDSDSIKPFERIAASSHYRVGWSDGYGYLLAATGRVDLMIEASVSVWDVAPYPVIFREAGGFFGDWRGRETIYSKQVIATNNHLLPRVKELLAE